MVRKHVGGTTSKAQHLDPTPFGVAANGANDFLGGLSAGDHLGGRGAPAEDARRSFDPMAVFIYVLFFIAPQGQVPTFPQTFNVRGNSLTLAG